VTKAALTIGYFVVMLVGIETAFEAYSFSRDKHKQLGGLLHLKKVPFYFIWY